MTMTTSSNLNTSEPCGLSIDEVERLADCCAKLLEVCGGVGWALAEGDIPKAQKLLLEGVNAGFRILNPDGVLPTTPQFDC